MTGIICDCCKKTINALNLKVEEPGDAHRVVINPYISVVQCSSKKEINFDLCTDCLNKLIEFMEVNNGKFDFL